jgi:two-component system, NtrC family, sensor kinase
MRSRCILLLLVIMLSAPPFAKGQQTDGLENIPEKAQADTSRVNHLLELSESYFFSNPDSCLIFANEAIGISRKIHFSRGEVSGLNYAGEAFRFLGDYPQALEMQLKALQINVRSRDRAGQSATMSFIGTIYTELNEYRQALDYLYPAYKINDSLSDPVESAFNLSSIGEAYDKMNILDSALIIQQQARAKAVSLASGNLMGLTSTRVGVVLSRLGRYKEALNYFHEALRVTAASGDKVQPSRIQYQIGELYLEQGTLDSALYYAKLAFTNGQNESQKPAILQASKLLIKIFRVTGLADSIIRYQEIAMALNDSLYGRDKLRQFQLLTLAEQQRQDEMGQEEVRYKNKVKTIALLFTLGFLLVIAIILFRNNRRKQKVNLLLLTQKNEIEETLAKLKSTQNQLIQREKMASLGEITAGIAHEIQNPLNFVNNFSEINAELIEEMKAEMDKGEWTEAKTKANEISGNEQKILNHGKRADAIVKSMLLHSRRSSGIKEPTDINLLVNEYLLLSLNGFRKNMESFNAHIETALDHGIGKINIVPQDMGRVLLNIYNNAFYTMAEKMKQGTNRYEPIITVSTKIKNGRLEIEIKDNGQGIPDQARDKIFQPFFTTKPTGQGTGLGLSLAYDIIKSQGGEIIVNTVKGDFTEFIVRIPV